MNKTDFENIILCMDRYEVKYLLDFFKFSVKEAKKNKESCDWETHMVDKFRSALK